MKVILLAVLLALCGACSNTEAAQHRGNDTDQVTVLEAHRLLRPDGPVLDKANLLDPAQEARLSDQLTGFNQRTGHALVVVTVETLGGDDIADYTLELFNRWGVGGAERGDGVVLLVAPNERKVRIATGYGMEEKLPDELCAQVIRDSIIPYFRTGDLVRGIDEGVSTLSALMSST